MIFEAYAHFKSPWIPYYFNTLSKHTGAELYPQAVKQDFKEKKIAKVIHLTTNIHAYCIMQVETN